MADRAKETMSALAKANGGASMKAEANCADRVYRHNEYYQEWSLSEVEKPGHGQSGMHETKRATLRYKKRLKEHRWSSKGRNAFDRTHLMGKICRERKENIFENPSSLIGPK
jgi:hypothetical protein